MAYIESGASSAGIANVDSNFNLKVNLPTDVTQAGYAQLAFSPDGAISKIQRITENGGLYIAEGRQILDIDFNAASTVWAAKIGTNATTMTKSVQNGYMRLNNSAITTTTTGISIYSTRVVIFEEGYDYRFKASIRHNNSTATSKQAEIGFGYYAFGTGQAAYMNEFIGFRWTTTGGLLGVVATSSGGAPTEQTIQINSNVPFSDNVARDYELVFTTTAVEFYANNIYQGRITVPSGSWGLTKQGSLPVIARIYNSGTASAAMTFDIGDISVRKVGPDDGQNHNSRLAAMGKSSYYFQPDITTATTATHNLPASGTAPTAATGSNTASVLNSTAQMGGFFRMNGATITATAQSTFWVAGYQNPSLPTAAGGATNARNFYVTSITVSPLVVSSTLTGGGFVANWFAAIGATALTSATTDADGTTAVAQKTDRLVPLARVTSFAAAAAAGVIETGAGENSVQFPTPLVIHPGEFLKIGLRTFQVTAAVTAGTIDGSINVNGYWD